MTEILEPPYTIPFIQRYLGVRRRDKASIESSGTSPSVILTDTDAATEDDGPTGSFQVVAANGNTAMMVAIDGGAMYFSMRDLDGEMRWRLKDGTGLNTRMTLTAAGLLEAVAFKGPLTGNVTGNVSGTALTVTQAAQSAITSLGTLTSATITGDLIVDTSTLKVDSSNDRVGIGTASPGSKLEVYHNAASEHVAVFDQDHATGEGVKITGDMAGAQAMLLIESVDSVTTPNAPEIFRINANGMIGMGTASPADKIHMVTTTGDCLLRTYNQVSGLLVGSSSPGAIVQTTGAVPLSLGTAGVDRMTITSAGVGIGIGTPAYKLDVDGDINYTGGSSIYYDTADAANSVAFRIDAGNQDVSIFRVSTDSWSTAVDYGATLKYMGTRTGNNNSLSIFMDNQIGTPVEAMTILQDGKVGIGTTTPQTQLQVRSAAAGSAGVQEALRVQGTWGAAGDGPLIRFTNYHGSGDNPNALEYNLGGIQGVDFAGNWGGGLSFQTPPAGDAGGGTLVERMIIREGGYIGVGATAPTAPLNVSSWTGVPHYMNAVFNHVVCIRHLNGKAWNTGGMNDGDLYLNYGQALSTYINWIGSGSTYIREEALTGSTMIMTGGKVGYLTSRAAMKDNVRDLTGAVDLVKQMRPVRFNFKPSAIGDGTNEMVAYDERVGFIAEEMADISHELAVWEWFDDDDKPLMVDPNVGEDGTGGGYLDGPSQPPLEEAEPIGWESGAVASVTVAALKELIARVEALEDA